MASVTLTEKTEVKLSLPFMLMLAAGVISMTTLLVAIKFEIQKVGEQVVSTSKDVARNERNIDKLFEEVRGAIARPK